MKGMFKNDKSCTSKSSKETSEVGQVKPRASSYSENEEDEGSENTWGGDNSRRACEVAGGRLWVNEKCMVISYGSACVRWERSDAKLGLS